MRKSVLAAPVMALIFGAPVFAQTGAAPTKVGIIHIQNAILQTKDGQKAAADIDAKYKPRREEVDKKQADLSQMEQQYRSGANTMSDDAKTKLARDIEQRRKMLQRDMDDAQAELDADQQRILQELGQKMMAVIDKFATERGYALILDVSSPQTPVLYAANAIDITRDIVDLYDKNAGAAAPAATAPATGGAAVRPATPPSAVPRPTAPAPRWTRPPPRPATTPLRAYRSQFSLGRLNGTKASTL